MEIKETRIVCKAPETEQVGAQQRVVTLYYDQVEGTDETQREIK